MSKQLWKPSTFIYPVPAIMVSCGDMKKEINIITIAWTGTICTNPAMTYISIKKERHSYPLIDASGEFVINLTTEKLAYATDFCGVKSGKDLNKFAALNLTPIRGDFVKAPLIEECPVNIECRVVNKLELGSHDMFLSEVLGIHIDEKYMDSTGKFNLDKANPICYSHGSYYGLKQKSLGHFGFSVKKSKKRK